MKDLETNKIAAAVLVAGLIALICGKIADGLYHPVVEVEKRGFAVEVAEAAGEGAATAEAEAPIDVAALLATGDAAAGEATFKGKCASCHTIDQGGKNGVGPNLFGSYGNKKGAHADYAYSAGMTEKGGTWTDDDLVHFLVSPRDFIKGTKMGFAGFRKNHQDVANVVTFLKSKK